MNHIFIGLGGTGGRILYAVRRAICQHYPGGGGETRKLEDGMLGAPEVRTGFLYVDSHSDDLNRAHDYLGESITLDPRWRLLIRDGNLSAIIQNLAQLPNIAPWLGDRHALQGVLAGGGNIPGAQQLRRMGRVLFANHLDAFRNRVRNLVGEVTAGAANEAHIHVCGTLAGGTGSGAIVDAVTQLRRLYPDSNDFKIYIYALITPDNAGNRDAGWFYPNQYAALKELNGIATGAYRPHNVANGERIAANAEVTACVLLSNINKANTKFTDVADQEQLAGDWLFQRTIGTRGIIPHGFDKAWTLEDHIATNPGEDRLPVGANQHGGAIQAGEYSRSYRFSTIGIKRWAIPEQEIREKLVFTIAERAIRQVLYANWIEQQGFLGARADRQPPAGWLPSETNTAWELTDDQMCLNQQEGQKKFREDWNNIAELLATRLRADGSKRRESWLAAASGEFEQFWQNKFRETGAGSFFTTRKETVSQRADELLRRIEDDLLKQWQTGRCGLHDMEKWLNDLDANLRSREEALPKAREQHQGGLDSQKGRLELIRQQWRKPRLLTRLWKYGSLLRSGLDALAKIHTEQTWLLARDYQEALLRTLRAKLATRKSALPALVARLSQIEGKLANDANARCKDSGQDFVKDLVVREFSSTEVGALSAALTTSKGFQEQVSGSVRTAFVEMSRNQASIAALSGLDADAIRSRIEKIANDALDVEHTRLTRHDGLKPVLGMSIVERLRVRFQGNLPSLGEHIHKLLSGATTSVKQASGQPKPETRGAPDDPPAMPHTQFAVFLPPSDGTNEEFYRQLETFFQGGLSGNANATVQLLKIGRPQEITMMAVDYWMAARFLEPLQALKAKYESTIAAHGADAVLRMHIEDAAADLPDLFKPLPVLKEASAWLFIGEKTGFVREDGIGGKLFAVFEGEDKRAYQPPVEIAVSRDGFFKGDIYARLAKLRDAFRTIFERLSQEGRHAWGERLTAAINAETDRVHTETGGRSESAAYREWLELAEEIKRIWKEVAR
jgi:hypothetical protein